jgi:hypothetical protein
MLYRAIEQLCTGTVSSISSYTSSNWVLGTNIRMYQKEPLGLLDTFDNFIGPNVTSKLGTAEQNPSPPISQAIACGITWSSTIDWIFTLENVSTQTKRISLYTYNRETGRYAHPGFITFTRTNSGAGVNKGLSVAYYTHTTGTVAVSGVTVTGTNTLFQTQRIAAGSRIGFGTTNPTAVTNWYYINSITSDTSLTLTVAVPSEISSGTSYVIEELRIIVADTVSTTSPLGGVFIAKGINFDDFLIAGKTISASSGSIDNLKLCYQLTDGYRSGGTVSVAGTVSNFNPQCCVLDGERKTDFDGLTHSMYVIDTASNARLYVYNIRSNDPITGGRIAVTQSNIQITGPLTLTGTFVGGGIGNIACLATTNHGPGKGTKSLYFATTTRIYRTDVTNLYHGKPNWINDVRNEIPTGSISTLSAGSGMYAISYDDKSDRFLINTTAGLKWYYTKFPEGSGDPLDYASSYNLLMLDSSNSDPRNVPLLAANTNNWVYYFALNGLTHLLKWGSGGVGVSNLFCAPFASHWEFANFTNEVAISPVINVTNVEYFFKLVIQDLTYLSRDTFLTTINRLRAYCRTTGIDNNTGGWEPIDDTGDLSSVEPTNQIQFKFEFQILGQNYNIPGRFFGFNLIYKEIVTDDHYQFSVGKSDELTKRFVWRFSQPFGDTVPTLRVRLYDNTTDNLLVDDNTLTPSGTFQKSTDNGLNWSAYSSEDKSNETTFIRYKPLYISDTVDVRPILTLL